VPLVRERVAILSQLPEARRRINRR
jgi:hypothetical protein